MFIISFDRVNKIQNEEHLFGPQSQSKQQTLADLQKVLNVPRILKLTLIMFLNIVLPKWIKFGEVIYKKSIILGNI